MNNWLDLSDNANTILSTIVDGFVDTSGGNIIIRENQHIEISGDVSFNQGGSFAVPTLKTDVLDTTGLVELALTKIEFEENPSFIQYAYDISGAESGGLAGQSISKNLAGDIIAVGAPLNSGGGTARGEVRVYQKNNNSWLQLGSDLNGAADNDEFGHSVDLNGDGTILGVGTKDTSNNLIIYQYDGSVWNQYGNNIHVVNNNISYNSHSLTPAIKVKLNKEGNKLVTMNKYNVADSQPGTTTVIVGPPFVQHGCTNNWDFRVASYGPITDDINSINVTYESGYNTNNAGSSTVENGFLVDFYGTTGQFGSVAQAMKIQNGLTYGGSNLSFEIYINVIEWNEWSRLFRWHPTGYNYIEVARSANNRYSVRCDGDSGGSQITAAIGSFTTSSGKAIYTTNGQFLHIVFTISGGNVVVYHDGAQVGSGSLTNPQNVYTSSDPNMHAIGAYTDNGSSWGVAVNAYFRYFRYYHNKTLSASEVTDLYNNRDDTSTATDGTPTTVNTIITTDYENEVVQAYEYSSPSWNQIGNTIESSSLHDISGGDIAINDEGNMIAIGYPQSKSSIQGTYSYSVIAGSGIYEIYGEEFTSDTANPVLTFKRGSTYNLTISAGSSHPFYIQTTENDGIYDSGNVYNNGVTNNGTGSGTITFVVPSDAPDTLYYRCSQHANMGNSISIVNESGNDGRTKVFKYDTTDSSWNQVGNNIDGEGQAGTAVVMDGSGDFVAIGSPNVNAGEVNVYQNVADTWTLYGNKIQGQADNDQFGTSLDIDPSGTILAVGAVNANAGKGNVNIYQYNTTDNSWNQLGGDLSGTEVGDLTGTSVKLNQLGTEVSVGEPTSNSLLGGSRTFEIENNKFYNGMTNPTFGIGVTNPTNRLDVDGTVYIDGKLQTNDLSQNSGTTTVSGDLTFNGSISVSSVNNSSLTYDTDMSVNLLKRLFVNPNDISTYGEASQTHASDLSDNTPPLVWNKIASHYNPEPTTSGWGDYFGWAVDINGDGTVIVVSEKGNNSGSQEGRVGVFQYDGANWSQKGDFMYGMTTLTSGLAGAAECVSINYYGNRVAWGAKTAKPDNGYNRGYVLAYDYNAGTNTWDLMGGDVVLKGTTNNQQVGEQQSVSLNKSTDSSIDGKFLSTAVRSLRQAFVYEWDGSAWNQKGTTIDDGDNNNRPSSVKMSDDGTALVVGMWTAGNSSLANTINSDNGAFAVYYWNGSDWALRGDYVYGTGASDYFGICVDINSDATIVVATAQRNDDQGTDHGHMRIFQYNSSNDTWEQKGNTVLPSTDIVKPQSHWAMYFGGTDALGMDGAGTRIVVATRLSGLATSYVYEYSPAFNTWEITQTLTREIETDDIYYGYSTRMSRDGRSIIIGDPYYDTNGLSRAGAVDIFQLPTVSPIYEFDVDISFNHSLVVPGNLVIVDGSNNTSYGSYTTYTSPDIDRTVALPANKSYHVGKSKSNVFNIVNQDNIGVYMNTGDTSFTSTSDERLKHNIQDTEDSLEKICALQPRKFKWKYNDKSESGFIAQEIEKVFPEMVDENTLPDGKTIKGVNHSSLLPYILDSLQSLDKEIDNLIDE